MENQEWPAEDYAVGAWIQATVADKYLPDIKIKADAKVLDVGCGDGAYTRKVLDKVPQGSVVGIDASNNMLALALKLQKKYPGFSVHHADVCAMTLPPEFDYAVSFWCLQWASDIKRALRNIAAALKPRGQLFAIFPSGDDLFINIFYALKREGRFKSLDHFQAPVDFSRMDNLEEKLAVLSFSSLHVELVKHKLVLPSLDIYRKFVNGLAFYQYQQQISDAEIKIINEAMVEYFDHYCKVNYKGAYEFHFSTWIIRAIK